MGSRCGPIYDSTPARAATSLTLDGEFVSSSGNLSRTGPGTCEALRSYRGTVRSRGCFSPVHLQGRTASSDCDAKDMNQTIFGGWDPKYALDNDPATKLALHIGYSLLDDILTSGVEGHVVPCLSARASLEA